MKLFEVMQNVEFAFNIPIFSAVKWIILLKIVDQRSAWPHIDQKSNFVQISQKNAAVNNLLA